MIEDQIQNAMNIIRFWNIISFGRHFLSFKVNRYKRLKVIHIGVC